MLFYTHNHQTVLTAIFQVNMG